MAQKMKLSMKDLSVNVTKSTTNCGFDDIYLRNASWKTSFFCAVLEVLSSKFQKSSQITAKGLDQ